jgi:hypothetical protein
MTFMTDGSATVIIPRPAAVISLSFIVLVETLPRNTPYTQLLKNKWYKRQAAAC